MKKRLLTLLICVFILTINAQNKTFTFQGYSIGASMSAPSNYPRAMMPEITKVGSEYIMYFGYESPTNSYILYATSNDMNTWTVGTGTCILGSTLTTDREFIVGGPRVIKLANGQYRMFYRASQQYSSTPYYHIRSAISNDGKNFTKEGICIEIKNYQSNSYFKHVGHSEFFYDGNGVLRAFLTAKDTTQSSMAPDNIYTAQSNDGGLTWGNFVNKYNSCHDPVIIRDSTHNFQAYFTYLNTGFRTVSSANGYVWPSTTNTLTMIQSGTVITESTSPIKIADLGAGVNAAGTIILFSNHATALGPWTHIAYWKDLAASLKENNNSEFFLNVFPLPANNQIEFKLLNNDYSSYEIINSFGNSLLIGKIESENTTISTENLETGIYILRIKGTKVVTDKKIIISK